MSGRDERLRLLLRDADPAREAPDLGADDVARLRRAVLSAVDREERTSSARPGFALAFAAAMAAVVCGLALWRIGLEWKSTPSGDRATASARPLVPSGHHDARPSTTREALPAVSTGSTTGATATPGSSPVPAASVTTGRAELASAHRNTTSREPRTSPQSSPRAIDSLPAGLTAETAPAETVAAVQPASGPPQPYQLQLTAPGGTRIVWLLTSSSGR